MNSRLACARGISVLQGASVYTEQYSTRYAPARARVKSGSFVLHDGMPGSELEYRPVKRDGWHTRTRTQRPETYGAI